MREIQCPACGQWEMMGADDPRWHSQWFRFLEVEEGGSEAWYECPECKARVKSCLSPTDANGEGAPMY